jgi:hypothetical protein
LPRLCLFLVGLWLGLILASWVAATGTFRTADRVLGPTANPTLTLKLDPLPSDDRRMVLRHLASEVNRWMFRVFGVAQLVLAGAVVLLAWRGGGVRYVLLAAAILTLGQLLAAMPIVRLGRAMDFLPRPLPPAIRGPFGALHAVYVITDLVKAALLATAAWVGRG